jgi:hypothetical protein
MLTQLKGNPAVHEVDEVRNDNCNNVTHEVANYYLNISRVKEITINQVMNQFFKNIFSVFLPVIDNAEKYFHPKWSQGKCSGHKKISVYRCCLLPVVCVTCVEMGLRRMFRAWVGAKWLVGEGQSVHSMGLVQREVQIVAQRATTPSKGFFISL